MAAIRTRLWIGVYRAVLGAALSAARQASAPPVDVAHGKQCRRRAGESPKGWCPDSRRADYWCQKFSFFRTKFSFLQDRVSRNVLVDRPGKFGSKVPSVGELKRTNDE